MEATIPNPSIPPGSRAVFAPRFGECRSRNHEETRHQAIPSRMPKRKIEKDPRNRQARNVMVRAISNSANTTMYSKGMTLPWDCLCEDDLFRLLHWQPSSMTQLCPDRTRHESWVFISLLRNVTLASRRL